MNSPFFAITVVAIGCLTAVMLKYLSMRAEGEQDRETPDEVSEKLDALEERIRVLERIVTEKRIDLRKEIDDL